MKLKGAVDKPKGGTVKTYRIPRYSNLINASKTIKRLVVLRNFDMIIATF